MTGLPRTDAPCTMPYNLLKIFSKMFQIGKYLNKFKNILKVLLNTYVLVYFVVFC